MAEKREKQQKIDIDNNNDSDDHAPLVSSAVPVPVRPTDNIISSMQRATCNVQQLEAGSDC